MRSENFSKRIKKNISLKNYTTFRVGGKAKYFFSAKNKEDLISAITWAKERKLPFFVLGGGSNVLFSDKGYEGLVVRLNLTNFKIRGFVLTAEAGVLMKVIVRETVKKSLAGFEWAGGLPGTVGGAVRGNAGAFGGEIKDNLIKVEAFDANKEKIVSLSKKECQFSYRNSIFKKRKNLIIISASFALKKGNKEELEKQVKDHIRYRKERHPLEYPNAGSIFKNCDLKKVPKKIREQFKEVVKNDPFPVIPTAAIIAKAGLAGKRVGGAEVSLKHPNYIVNKNRATAEDILELINFVKQKIKAKFGIELEEEIQFVGF